MKSGGLMQPHSKLPSNVQKKGFLDTVEAEIFYLDILAFLQAADPSIRIVDQVLVNDGNTEWLAMVTYVDGSHGAVEGKGRQVLRQTGSQELSERLLDVDSGHVLEALLEPREP
jgi:hypothetical protein